MVIKLESKGRGVHVGFFTKAHGKRKIERAVRIQQEAAGFRIDVTSAVAGAWMPWEALTTEVFPTFEAAEAFLQNNPCTSTAV